MPSLRKLLVGWIVWLAAVAPARATTFLHETFNGPGFPPAGWTVIDNSGSGVVWSSIAGAFEDGNYTAAGGNAATVSPERLFGDQEFDTELRTPAVGIPAGNFYLRFQLNYRKVSDEQLVLEVSGDGKNWQAPVSIDQSFGGLRQWPGECIDVGYVNTGEPGSAIFRLRYFDAGSGDTGGYVQVDEFRIDDQVVAPCIVFFDGFETGNTSAWITVPAPVSPTVAGPGGPAFATEPRRRSGDGEPAPRRRWWSRILGRSGS